MRQGAQLTGIYILPSMSYAKSFDMLSDWQANYSTNNTLFKLRTPDRVHRPSHLTIISFALNLDTKWLD